MGWQIENMVRNATDGGVTEVLAYYVMTEDDNQVFYSTYETFTPDSESSDFVEWEDLTIETVSEWLNNLYDMDEIEAQLTQELTIKKGQVEGLPW